MRFIPRNWFFRGELNFFLKILFRFFYLFSLGKWIPVMSLSNAQMTYNSPPQIASPGLPIKPYCNADLQNRLNAVWVRIVFEVNSAIRMVLTMGFVNEIMFVFVTVNWIWKNSTWWFFRGKIAHCKTFFRGKMWIEKSCCQFGGMIKTIYLVIIMM